MICKFQVFAEIHNKWPAKGTRPAGEAYNLLLLDMTLPAKHALRDLYNYRMTEDEVGKYYGQLERRIIEVGVTQIYTGDGKPLLRGEIVKTDLKVN